MKVLHTSNLLGNLDRLLSVKENFDLWIDTGNFFPQIHGNQPETIRKAQTDWLKSNNRAININKWLAYRKLLCVKGPHDHAELSTILNMAPGLNSISGITLGETPVSMFAKRWVGCNKISASMYPRLPPHPDFCTPTDLTKTFDKIINNNADILLTHTQPQGVLCSPADGCSSLKIALQYREHNIRHHFFNGIYRTSGTSTTIEDTRYYCGNQGIIIHTI